MALYRKTALTEATQFWPNVKPWPEGVEVDSDSPTGYGIYDLEHTKRAHEVTPGDFIATGTSGEHWAIKADIFAAAYEAVNAAGGA